MPSAALVGILAVGVGFCMPAAAEGVELTFGVGFRVETDSNLNLTPGNTQSTSTTGLNLSFGLISTTALSSLSVQGSGQLQATHGPGSPLSGFNNPSLSFGYDRAVANAALNVNGSINDTDLSTNTDVTDFTAGAGQRRTASLDASINWGTAAPFGYGFSAGVTDNHYHNNPSPGLIDNRTIRIGADIRADLSPVLHLTLGVDDSKFDQTGFATRDTLGANLGLTFDRPTGAFTLLLDSSDTPDGRRSSLSFGQRVDLVSGGLSYSLGVTRGVTGQANLTGDFNYTRDLPNGAITLGLSRAVQSDAETDSETLLSNISAAYNRAVTSTGSIALALNWAEQRDTATNLVTANTNLSATWTQDLTQDWALDLGYTHRLRDDALIGRGRSDAVFLELHRDFKVRY